jgi:hypothetical protein
MPNYKKDLNITMSAQQTLFATKFSEGELDVSMPFRDSLSRAMRKQDVSRYHLAATISELSVEISLKDCWINAHRAIWITDSEPNN